MRLHIFFQNLFHVFEFTYCKIYYIKHKKNVGKCKLHAFMLDLFCL